MQKVKSLMVAGFLVCAFALVAVAQAPAANTDNQRAEYIKLYKEYENRVMPLHDKLMAKMMELNAVENLQSASVADVQKIIAEITTLKEQMRTERNTFDAALEKAGLPSYSEYGMGGGYRGHRGHGMMGGQGYHQGYGMRDGSDCQRSYSGCPGLAGQRGYTGCPGQDCQNQ